MRNIYLKISWTKCGGENSLRPCSEKIKIQHISESIVSCFIQFVFNDSRIIVPRGNLPLKTKTNPNLIPNPI